MTEAVSDPRSVVELEVAGPSPTPYDHVAYRTLPLPQTHPDRLAVNAALLGMRPAPIDRCRVLELGCGDGSNLIPMAYGLPGSEFVGIDLAATAIERGAAAIRTLGLTNATLRHLGVEDVDDALGPFDYVIAHGLYSWVPEAARDGILAVCRSHLAPEGVAYVSYNTYPGCHIRQAVRRVLRFDGERVEDAEQRIARARTLASLIAECPGRAAGAAALPDEMRRTLDHDPWLFFHDDLAPINVPVYFHEFAAHAARHGLQFLAEANFHESQEGALPPRAAELVRSRAAGDRILAEQYLDFFLGRRFRQTLLCRQEAALDRDPRSDVLRGFWAASAARSVADRPDIRSAGVVEEYRAAGGAGVATGDPLAKAAVHHLGRMWPELVGFDDVLHACRRALGTENADADALCDVLLAAYSAGLVELSTRAPRFVLEPGARPTASAVARLQLESGARVATLQHTSVSIEDRSARALLGLLDGTRDRASLRDELNALIGRDVPLPDGALAAPPVDDQGLDRILTGVARLRLLVA